MVEARPGRQVLSYRHQDLSSGDIGRYRAVEGTVNMRDHGAIAQLMHTCSLYRPKSTMHHPTKKRLMAPQGHEDPAMARRNSRSYNGV